MFRVRCFFLPLSLARHNPVPSPSPLPITPYYFHAGSVSRLTDSFSSIRHITDEPIIISSACLELARLAATSGNKKKNKN